jgi:AAA ATPase domain
VGSGSTAKQHRETTATDGGGTCTANDLYERETELAALSQALAAARSGAGGLVLIEGLAGIGKSRLLAEARAMADALGMTVLTARGIDLDRDAPFGVVSDLFTAVLAAASAAGRAQLLSGQAALAAALFDPAAAPPVADPSALVRGLYWLTVNVAADMSRGAEPGRRTGTGLLIEVDDAQWADRPSLSYLAHLAARIDELPVALVVAVRSGEQAADQQTLDWLRDQPGRAPSFPEPSPRSPGPAPR